MENGGLKTGDDANTVQILFDCAERGKNFANELEQLNKKNSARQLRPPIGVVPSYLRDVSPSCFQPRMVSIGPLHREDKDVKEFERQKESYLAHLLSRTCSSAVWSIKILNACVQKVNGSMDRIRATYAQEISYSNAELATIMVMDACFIIEYLNKHLDIDQSSSSQHKMVLSYIAIDLVLLENQIPFFVLQDIFKCIYLRSTPTATLVEPLLRVLSTYINPFVHELNTNVVGDQDTRDCDHILGLLHNLFKTDATSSTCLELPTYQSAAELIRAGVTFKPNKEVTNCWPMAMQYEPYGPYTFINFNYLSCYKPIFKMPALKIEDQTEKLLRNFIAYEQSSNGVSYYFTSYCRAMDALIDTTEDVCKLVQSEVIVNNLGSNADAVKMINDICKEVCFQEFFYYQQWVELDDHYKRNWPKNIAWLKRRYFSSPWSVIALFAGIAVFVLTVIQTVFAVKVEIIN